MHLNLAAPEGAVRLFNGVDMDGWTKRDGSPAVWRVEDGVMTSGGGDIMTEHRFSDAYIHLEFALPYARGYGQARGNSGGLQGRHEIQYSTPSASASLAGGLRGHLRPVRPPDERVPTTRGVAVLRYRVPRGSRSARWNRREPGTCYAAPERLRDSQQRRGAGPDRWRARPGYRRTGAPSATGSRQCRAVPEPLDDSASVSRLGSVRAHAGLGFQ